MTTRFRNVLAVTVAALAFGVSTRRVGGVAAWCHREGSRAPGGEGTEGRAAATGFRSVTPAIGAAIECAAGEPSAWRNSRARVKGAVAVVAVPRKPPRAVMIEATTGSLEGRPVASPRAMPAATIPSSTSHVATWTAASTTTAATAAVTTGGGHSNRPPRIIQRFPSGYRDYSWGGNRYYYSGGYWYRPYGSSFISIGAPYGLFVGTLPGYYSSFYYDDTRYFYSDNTYYTYEPVRRGYVVARSPYGRRRGIRERDAGR